MAEASKITVIAADPKLNIDYAERDKNMHKRVAAYCRVSTENDEQINSYDQQVQEWNNRLTSNPNYTLVKIYTDKGISGTSDKNRTGFQEMMADAKAGKLDMIFTKSISRFARNTVLTLKSIKKLKEWHVEVWFDNENMSSWDPKSEAMFAIMSTMAQEESRHISENVRWTFQKKMKEGYDFTCAGRFLGYDRDPETKKLVINEEEAKAVRLVFDMYTAGYGPSQIARECEKRGYKTGGGKTKWQQSTIQGILRNEKYKGDLCIGPNKDVSKYNARHAMSARIICVHCGNGFTRRQWVNGSEGLRFLYQCSNYIHAEPGHRCQAKPVSENVLMTAACEIINKMCVDNGNIFKRVREHINSILAKRDFTDLIKEKMDRRETLEKEIDFFLQEKMKSRDEGERYYLDNKYHNCIKEVNDLNAELKELEAKQIETDNLQERLRQINKILSVGEVTPEMLTVDIMDAFIYKIIAVSKREAVFVINETNTLTFQDFVDKRKEIVFNEVLFSGIVNCQGTQRNDYLNYKVVAI